MSNTNSGDKVRGKSCDNAAYYSTEEITAKSSKSTQMNNAIQLSSVWKYYSHGLQKSQPTSVAYSTSKQNSHYEISESSYSTRSQKNTLYSAQSELVLSPRSTKQNKYVTLDMRSMFAAAPAAQLHQDAAHSNYLQGMGGPPYTCCCSCMQLQQQQQQFQHGSTASTVLVTDSHDGPTGLSWRRLHMSRAKLKATATTSELLSGFAMVAMVELQINDPTAVPEWLFVMFAVCTTILVSVHIFALMISTYLLPNIEAISKLEIAQLVTESPHERMRGFIELAWAFSTVLGLFLFLVEIAILCWVKFWDYSFTAATASTIIVIPVLIVFVAFAIHFYHSLVVYKCETSTSDMKKLESIKRNLDNVTMGNTIV